MKKVKNSWSFENFRKGPLTTIIGVGLMVVAIYVYLAKPEGETFAYFLFGFGAVAFGLKDPKLPGGKGGTGSAVVLVALFMLSSCVTYKKCADKFGSTEKYAITLHDTIPDIDTTYVAGDSVKGSVDLDDLLAGKIDSLINVSSSRKLQIKLWYDKYNHLLRYRADVKPDTIIKIERIPVEVKGDCPDTVILDESKNQPWHRRVWERFKSLSVWALLLFIAVLIMVSKWKKLKGGDV